MKNKLTGAALAAAFALSGSASAMTVFADFNGDGVHDPNFDLADSVTVDVYAQLTTAEDDAGGLLSFATEGMLNPTGLVNVTTGNIESAPWSIGPELQLDDNSVRASGGTLGGQALDLVKLFSVELNRVAVGVTTFSFADWEKSASFDGNVLADDDFTVLDGSIEYLSTEIGPVPIPAAAWLFGSALLGLIGLGKRRKA